jgi:hypothetical protein
MTKQLRTMIDAENERRGLKHYQVGALTTYTRGFGLRDDMRIGETMNAGGGVIYVCVANVRAFRAYLLRNQKIDGSRVLCFKTNDASWDAYTVVYLDIPPVNRNGELFRECVGMSGHSECMLTADNKHLGTYVMFDTLPETLQSIVRADIAEIASKARSV